MSKERISQWDLTGVENAELMKLVKTGYEESTVMTWGLAMIARRRAGEPDLKFADVLSNMTLRDVTKYADLNPAEDSPLDKD